MRLVTALACGVLGGCTTGAVSVPNAPVGVYEVTPPPNTASASSAGGTDFTSTIENSLADGGGTVPAGQRVTPLDDDELNLTLYTIEQQKIDAAAAERELQEARSQLVIVQPGSLPDRVEGVNIALYAQQSNNRVGERVYRRSGSMFSGGSCGRFATDDEAQRTFLAAGGPETDRYNLDPDGDGFACRWDPELYRQLRY